MDIVAVDIGNSCIKTADFINDSCKRFIRIGHLDNPFRAIEEFYKHINKSSLNNIIISSVNKKIENLMLIKLLNKNYCVKKINKQKNIGIKIKYNIKNLGIDRYLNVIAARNLYKSKNLIVMDFGTSLTIDIIKNNTYYGGYILPGFNLILNSLINNTDLPKTDGFSKTDISDAIPTTTKTAVNSGAYLLFTGGINHILRSIKKNSAERFSVIGTGGGLSELKELPFKMVKNSFLTLNGINILKKKATKSDL